MPHVNPWCQDIRCLFILWVQGTTFSTSFLLPFCAQHFIILDFIWRNENWMWYNCNINIYLFLERIFMKYNGCIWEGTIHPPPSTPPKKYLLYIPLMCIKTKLSSQLKQTWVRQSNFLIFYSTCFQHIFSEGMSQVSFHKWIRCQWCQLWFKYWCGGLQVSASMHIVQCLELGDIGMYTYQGMLFITEKLDTHSFSVFSNYMKNYYIQNYNENCYISQN